MAVWVCAGCGCRYAVGAPCCPECRDTRVEEDAVAKSNFLGASNVAAGPGEVGFMPPPEPVEAAAAAAVPVADVEAAPEPEAAAEVVEEPEPEPVKPAKAAPALAAAKKAADSD